MPQSKVVDWKLRPHYYTKVSFVFKGIKEFVSVGPCVIIDPAIWVIYIYNLQYSLTVANGCQFI